MDNEVSTIRSDIGYKGKSTKFWLQLPEEVLRLAVSRILWRHTRDELSVDYHIRSLIATHYLYILAEQSYCPTTWDNRKLWYSRMAYTCIRDALDIERHISSICPEWRRGSEYFTLLFLISSFSTLSSFFVSITTLFAIRRVDAHNRHSIMTQNEVVAALLKQLYYHFFSATLSIPRVHLIVVFDQGSSRVFFIHYQWHICRVFLELPSRNMRHRIILNVPWLTLHPHFALHLPSRLVINSSIFNYPLTLFLSAQYVT